MKPRLAVITFPGNNCETESLRAAERNGFEAELVLWNEIEKIGNYDAYFIIGGFAFEDRGRSGAIPAREPIADALREEAKKGKVILGVCNGAQMIVESGMIPIGENPAPFALAHNVRRDREGHVMGTGYYNVWIQLKKINPNTAFTCACADIIRVPVAHGEGRFTSIDPEATKALEGEKNVAFRYCDQNGKVDPHFPITPNGAYAATAMVVNDEGTVGAIMPHPERFYKECDGDQVLGSMRKWIEEKKSPSAVKIGEFQDTEIPQTPNIKLGEGSMTIEKKLIITDNEAFSVSQTASYVAGEKLNLEKSLLYEITPSCHSGLDPESLKELREKILESGLILNENKEVLVEKSKGGKYAVLPMEDDTATALGEKLSAFLKSNVKVKIYTCWNFGNAKQNMIDKVLKNRLLANPNSAKILKAN